MCECAGGIASGAPSSSCVTHGRKQLTSKFMMLHVDLCAQVVRAVRHHGPRGLAQAQHLRLCVSDPREGAHRPAHRAQSPQPPPHAALLVCACRGGYGDINITKPFYSKEALALGADGSTDTTVRVPFTRVRSAATLLLSRSAHLPSDLTCNYLQDVSDGAFMDVPLLLAIIFSVVIASVCGLGVMALIIVFGLK